MVLISGSICVVGRTICVLQRSKNYSSASTKFSVEAYMLVDIKPLMSSVS